MPDPVRVFLAESESKRETLKVLWPDLYSALMPSPSGPRVWPCALHGPDRTGGQVVGRLWRNGPPACRPCLDRASDRDGGYPLELSKGGGSR